MISTKITIVVGSGGVGKTTIAATLGVISAKAGKKVLVLTIDPSKRLAQTFGIEGKTEITKVPGQNFPGELYAGVINHKKVFDEFVSRASGRGDLSERILKNRLYEQLSTTLSGSQEFTALEKLFSTWETGEFDEIILDTPPAKHALDFLNAPQKLAGLFNEKVAKWFRAPDGDAGLFGRIVASGTKQVMKILESLTGGAFVKELSDFFRVIEAFQGKLQKRTTDVHRLLTSEQTQFHLVTSFDESKLKEAEAFSKEIRIGGYVLTHVHLNRCFPFWLNDQPEALAPIEQSLFDQMKPYFEQKAIATEKFATRLDPGIRAHRIPDLVDDISHLESLSALCQYVGNDP